MASSGRGLRLLKSIEILSKAKPHIFENQVFEKVKITSISNGAIKGWFTVEPNMCNLAGILHGGYMASVIDVMAYYAELSNTGGRVALTTNMSINYMAMVVEGEKVTVETTALKRGQGPIIESWLYNEEGRMLAKATNSFSVSPERYQFILKDIFDLYDEK